MTPPRKIYLGDSVYVAFDGYGLVLTTENGLGPSNTIYLEPSVYDALLDYVNYLRTNPKAASYAEGESDSVGPQSEP